jgi:hypothetical protein
MRRLTSPSRPRATAPTPARATVPMSARATALMATLGCGPTVSLDDPDVAGSSGTSTGAGPFGELTAVEEGITLDGPDDGARLDLGNVKLDVAPDIPLPPGSCPPDCQPELGLAWSYDGFGRPEPLVPEDRVAVIVEPGGSITVAEMRQGELELARLSELGQEQWVMPVSLPCDPCRLVDLSLHPSGDLLIAGWGLDATGTPAALAARVELGGPQLVWATSTALAIDGGTAPRAGSLVVYDESLLFQPVIEGSTVDGIEQLELFAYDGTSGGLLYAVPVTTGLASGDAPPPLATYDAFGTLAVTHPAWTGAVSLSGTVSWLSEPISVLATTSRVEPSLRLAAGPDGRVLTLGQTPGELQSLLYLDSGDQRSPDQWQIIYVLPTITSSTPALAVDDYGHAHVVTRAAAGRPGFEASVGLEVLRWSEAGTLIWKLSLPVALDHVDEPVSLALDFDGTLVLGGFMGGARHVEKRVHDCICG